MVTIGAIADPGTACPRTEELAVISMNVKSIKVYALAIVKTSLDPTGVLVPKVTYSPATNEVVKM